REVGVDRQSSCPLEHRGDVDEVGIVLQGWGDDAKELAVPSDGVPVVVLAVKEAFPKNELDIETTLLLRDSVSRCARVDDLQGIELVCRMQERLAEDGKGLFHR